MKNLKMLRIERNLSQQKLAQLVGASQQSINKYENGLTEPDFNMLKQLAEFFHTSIDYLIGYTDNPNICPSFDETTILRETSVGEYTNIYETTPKERHLLSMYRKLPSDTQNHIDGLLEALAPDDDYKQFQKS